MTNRILLSERAEHRLNTLSSSKRIILLRAFRRTVEHLREDIHFGQQIPRRQIPREYLRIGIGNFHRIGLPLAWRLLYTVQSRDQETVVFVVDILSHKDYDRLFGY